MRPTEPASIVEATPSGFFGWRVVAGAFVIAVFGWGLGFYGPPVYLEAVRAERGWAISTVSGAITLHFLVGAAVVANLPRLHARFGLRATTLLGALCLSAGIAGWAASSSPWQLYGAAIMSGTGWAMLGAAAVNAIVAPWFVTKRPAALSMAYNGASIGGVIFSPLWVAAIGCLGFQTASLLVGGVTLAVVGLLAVLVLGRTPVNLGQEPDGGPRLATPARAPEPALATERPLRRDPAFLSLAAGMALALFAQIGLIAHLVSLLRETLGLQGAGWAAGLATAAAIVGRSLVGWCMPAGADRRLVAAASLLVQALGCLVMLGAGEAGLPLLVGILLFGLGIGNATSLPPLIAQAEFASASGRVVALVVAFSQAAYAFAPASFGLLRDGAGGPWLFVLAGLLQLAAAAIYVTGRRVRAVSEPSAAPREPACSSGVGP